jgi:hypothetical protein
MPEPTTIPADLKAKLARPVLLNVFFLPVLLFIPARTLDYWQGWAFIAVSVVFPLGVMVYFYKRDPQALARRLLRREKIFAQKFMVVS